MGEIEDKRGLTFCFPTTHTLVEGILKGSTPTRMLIAAYSQQPKLGTAQVPIHRRVDKQNGVRPPNGRLLGKKQEWALTLAITQ